MLRQSPVPLNLVEPVYQAVFTSKPFRDALVFLLMIFDAATCVVEQGVALVCAVGLSDALGIVAVLGVGGMGASCGIWCLLTI